MGYDPKNFKTLPQTLKFLQEKGYVETFTLLPYCLECPRLQMKLGADEFSVDRLIRFRGGKLQEDARLYAITSGNGLKGVLVENAQSHREVVPEMARRLLGTDKA